MHGAFRFFFFSFLARALGRSGHAGDRLYDVLDIGVRCAAIGRSSIRFMVEIYLGEQHLISGELSYVYADTSVRKGVALPERWREIISGLEITRPESLPSTASPAANG